MNCKMCTYKTTDVSEANKHALIQHDKPIGQCFKRKRKYVKKKKPDVCTTIDTRSIIDHMAELKALLPKDTFCIPMSKDKRPCCKYKVEDDLSWEEPYEKAKSVDAQITDTTPMYGVRCSKVCLVDCDLDKAGLDLPEEFRTTLTQRTGGGGKHYLFLRDERMILWKDLNGITDFKLDIKTGDNAMFIGSGSESKKGKYSIITKMAPQPMPDTLFEMINKVMSPRVIKPKAKSPTSVCDISKVQQKPKSTTLFPKLIQAVGLLTNKRFLGYDNWRNSGFAIHYESNGSEEGFQLFMKKSRKAPGYQKVAESVYREFWNGLQNSNTGAITMGSIKHWIKEDTPIAYMRTYHPPKVFSDQTEANLAELFYDLYGEDWFYKDGQLYHWNGTYWKTGQTDRDNRVFMKQFQRKLPTFILKYESYVIDQTIREKDEKQREMLQNYTSKIHDVVVMTGSTQKTKNTLESFKSIVTEVKKTDLDPYIFVFENCVFNLKTGQKIDPATTKSKYMTMSTGYDYRAPTQDEIDVMNGAIAQIFTNEAERKAHLTILATGLLGITLQKFIIANGGGGNGKGMLHDSFMFSIGDYGYTLKNTVILKERKDGPDQNIANMHLKRFVIVREPPEGKAIEFSTVKDLTGGNEINADGKYSTRTKVRLHSTMVLEANKVPLLNCDGAKKSDKRRIVDVLFGSSFVAKDDPTINNIDVFAGNSQFEEDEWREQHKFALFEIVKAHCVEYSKTRDLDQFLPQSIKDRTDAYLGKCNVVKTWITDNYERCEKSFIKVNDVHAEFKDSDLYMNMDKKERRQYGKTNFKDKMCKWFKGDYKERIKINKKDLRSVLVGWKKYEEGDVSEDEAPIFGQI